jgi:predicted GIY-YIG superfamily endonuclease
MSINQYSKSFQYLIESDLPLYYERLKQAMKDPMPMSNFAIEGVGIAGIICRLELKSDFSGCYVLLDRKKPLYVGISKTVLKRLRQHVRGTTHFDASLAYRIASAKNPHNQTRSNAMKSSEFKTEFDSAKEYIRGLNVAYVKIDNPLVLYIFEPYCAMNLDTSEWNTFETH